MEGRRGWENLGMVETIYEEEHEDYTSIPSPSLSLSSSSTPLHSRVEAWSLTTGCEPDVLILIQKSCFHLHKDPLASRSGYLKRQMSNSSRITLSPPLKITADTFTLVADFCYGSHLFITPFNIATLRTAAELLEMTEVDDINDDNLRQKTEAYFDRTVVANPDYASTVLRSCLSLLPEAETTASLLSRCIEALSLMKGSADIINCLDEIKMLTPEDFQLVVKSMHGGFTSSNHHDLLYRIIDLYLKEHNGKITEEQKSRICNYIDCTNLSPQFLMHAVQNPRMPLRFIVQAMFIEQLNTRRSVFSAAHNQQNSTRKHQHRHQKTEYDESTITLGTILQREATLRQVAHMKANMDATSARIQSLEKELSGMRRLLNDSESVKNALVSGKSESFRFGSERKVERGQRGSVSSGSLGDIKTTLEEKSSGLSSSSESGNGIPVPRGNFGRRLMKGLKSALRVSASSKSGNKVEKNEGKVGDAIVIKKKKDQPFHHEGLAL